MKHAPGLTGAGEGKSIWRKVLPLLIDVLQIQPGFDVQETANVSENDPWKQLEVLQIKCKRNLLRTLLRQFDIRVTKKGTCNKASK